MVFIGCGVVGKTGKRGPHSRFVEAAARIIGGLAVLFAKAILNTFGNCVEVMKKF